MRYYIIAGEASGDLHGSHLMKSLKMDDPDADFRFWGGDLMLNESPNMVKHYQEMAFMGFMEVFKNLSAIFANIRLCKRDLLKYKPDVLILIDYPGFNLRIAGFAKSKGIKVCYYIAPKVWAWNEKRIHRMRKAIDRLFCILPFESDYFNKRGIRTDYVGNPILDAISSYKFDEHFRIRWSLTEQPIIALLPGSRKQEIERILPEMLKACDRIGKEYQVVIAAAPGFTRAYYEEVTGRSDLTLVVNKTYDLLRHSIAALVTSGTATLETGLFKVPQIVCYKGHPLTIFLARRLVKIKYISLVNLIMGKKLVRKMIQGSCRAKPLGKALNRLIKDVGYRVQILNDYALLNKKIGEPGASARVSGLIQDFIKS